MCFIKKVVPVEICVFCGKLEVTEHSVAAGYDLITECEDCFIAGCHEVVRSEVITEDDDCPF